MSSRRNEFNAEVRFRILRLINEYPNMSTRQIAKSVGISNGSAYYCLTALIKKGLVKLGNFVSSPCKKKYAYFLTPTGLREKTILTAKFLDLKMKEFDQLKKEIQLLESEVKLQNDSILDAINKNKKLK